MENAHSFTSLYTPPHTLKETQTSSKVQHDSLSFSKLKNPILIQCEKMKVNRKMKVRTVMLKVFLFRNAGLHCSVSTAIAFLRSYEGIVF